MNVKKSMAIIITLILMILPMMTISAKAVTLGEVYNLQTETQGNIVSFYWDRVSQADGYDIFINVSGGSYKYIGSVTDTQARLIGFKAGKEYLAKVRAYQKNSNGTKTVGDFSKAVTVNTTVTTNLSSVKTLTATQNGGYVTLNWSNVSNATGYEVYVKVPYLDYICIGSVNTNNAILQGFEDGITYQFKVMPYQQKGNGTRAVGGFSPEKTLTIRQNKYEDDKQEEIVESKPDRVQDLRVDDVDKNTAYISWGKVNDADGYDILLAKGNGAYKYVSTVYKTNATLKQLDYDTTYKVKVVAFKDGKDDTIFGEESSYQRFTTEKETIDLAAVRNLKASVDETNATVSWSKVSGADGYGVWINRNNGTYHFTINTNKTELFTSKLDYNTTYSVKVIPYVEIDGRIEYGKKESSVKFTTPREQTVGQVKNLQVEESENKAYLSWSRVSNADGYNIYVSKNNGRYEYYKTTTSRNTTLTNLDYNTTYRVKVVAYEKINGREKEGEESAIQKFTTSKKELTRASHLTAEVRNRNEAYIQWWPIEEADGYEVYLAQRGRSFSKIDDISKNYITIYSSQLEYNTTYQVKVRAYEYVNGRKQYAPDSETISFKTERESSKENNEDVARVNNVKVSVVKDAATLTWNEVKNAKYYEITLTIPGLGGSSKFIAYTNSKTITGLTEKQSNYTARIRAYEYVNGRLVAGQYSDVIEFKAK